MVSRSNQQFRHERSYNLMLLEYVEGDTCSPAYQVPMLRCRQICVFYTICAQVAILDGNHTKT